MGVVCETSPGHDVLCGPPHLVGFGVCQDTTLSPSPCWEDAFNRTDVGGKNPVTCYICTTVFQGLDDYLLNNEEQIAHALENLCEGFPWLFEVCWRLIEACMDDIIEMLVRDGLNPKIMCEALFLCP